MQLTASMNATPVSSSTTASTISTLTTIVRSTFLALPDAFVALPLWHSFPSASSSSTSSHPLSGDTSTSNMKEHFERVLLALGDDDGGEGGSALRATVLADLKDLECRREAARGGLELREGEDGGRDGSGSTADDLETIEVGA